MGTTDAQEALTRARKQLERVQAAVWEPPDPEEAVTWAFYAYENALEDLASELEAFLDEVEAIIAKGAIA